MLKLNLKPVFQARGIERPYTFLVKAGLSPHSANVILNSASRVFRLDHIEVLCEKLNCTPNDILIWIPAQNSLLSEKHPLNRLKQGIPSFNWKETFKTIPLEQLNEIAEALSKPGADKT